MRYSLDKLDIPTLEKKKKELEGEYSVLAETISRAQSVIRDTTVKQLELKGQFKFLTSLLEGGLELNEGEEKDKTAL